MSEFNRKTKISQEDKVRCANYLIQMIEKYGAEIMAECKKEKETGKNA